MKTILIVDDEVSIRRIYKKVFEEEGYETVEASNAGEAINILKHEDVNLILLDINLGEVDGDVLYDIVNLFYKKIKVIVSSVCFIEDQRRYIKGAFDYYDKSDRIGVLLEKVNKALTHGESKILDSAGLRVKYRPCDRTIGY